MMRILHIIQRYHPAVGGAEIYMREISAQLAAQGHQVTVLTTDALDFELFWIPGRRRIAEREGQHEGVRILRFPVRHLPGGPLMYSAWRRLLWLLSSVRPIPAAWLARLARYTPWVPDLYRWLETTQEPFDLVAAMTICYEPLLEAGLRFARRRGIPFVAYPLTHLGAGAAPASDALSRFYTMRHQVAIVRGSDAVITATPAEKAFYQQRGVPGERIVVAGPGIEPTAVLGGDGGRFRDAQGHPRPSGRLHRAHVLRQGHDAPGGGRAAPAAQRARCGTGPGRDPSWHPSAASWPACMQVRLTAPLQTKTRPLRL